MCTFRIITCQCFEYGPSTLQLLAKMHFLGLDLDPSYNVLIFLIDGGIYDFADILFVQMISQGLRVPLADCICITGLCKQSKIALW